VNSADLVLGPLSNVSDNPAISSALATWEKTATPEQQTKWANRLHRRHRHGPQPGWCAGDRSRWRGGEGQAR